jgi:hypothetical protein
MNEQQLDAVKQALEALEFFKGLALSIEEIERAEEAITALQSIISQDALDKKAENARELGLSYDDEPKIGCVNHDCDQCKAVQEPVAWVTGFYAGRCVIQTINPAAILPVGIALYTSPPPPQPVPVKTYHDGKPWPVQPKPWVGLSEKEVEAYDSWADFQVGCGRQTLFDMVRDIEAKLKEKNT